ncbi:MAG: hypothetical protein ABI131_06485, partial [Nostocoides sp.]
MAFPLLPQISATALVLTNRVDMSTPRLTISATALFRRPGELALRSRLPEPACGKLRGARSDSWHPVAMLGPNAPVPFDPSGLYLAGPLRRSGIEPRKGGWTSVRHGVWIAEAEWKALNPALRHSAFVHATMLVCDPGSEHVVSHS